MYRILPQSCREQKVGAMKSMIKHKIAGMRCFARVKLEKRMVIGCVHSMLRYSNLCRDKDLDGKYQEKVLPMSVEEFQVYSVQVSNSVEDCDRRSHHANKVHVWFNPLQFNDPW